MAARPVDLALCLAYQFLRLIQDIDAVFGIVQICAEIDELLLVCRRLRHRLVQVANIDSGHKISVVAKGLLVAGLRTSTRRQRTRSPQAYPCRKGCTGGLRGKWLSCTSLFVPFTALPFHRFTAFCQGENCLL